MDGGSAAGATAGLTVSAGAYADTAASSARDVTFNATWTGGAKEDYIIVNWLKGSMKDPSGTPFKVMMYGNLVDFDFGAWQVDSVDADPAYWSLGGTRWRYTVTGPNAFSATDRPSPPSFAVGTKASVDFKTAVYKSSDVPMTTTGQIAATPLSAFALWDYKMEVVAAGSYRH